MYMKQLQNYAYYTTQIQGKYAQIVGTIGLDLYLPPQIHTTRIQQSCQVNYFDSEVQYFIIQEPQKLFEVIKSTIILNTSKALKKDVTIEASNSELISNNPKLIFHYELNQKQATICVYCFQLKEDRLVRIKSWRKCIDKTISAIVKQVQAAAVCYQFTAIQIKQLAIDNNQVFIHFSLARKLFNILLPLDDINWEENNLFDEIKNSILVLALKNGLSFKSIQTNCITLQSIKFADCYQNQSWLTKSKFIYFCQKELNITIQQLCLVRCKPKIYLNNICQVIAEYLGKAYFFSQQIHTQLNKIVQESKQQIIFSLFNNLYQLIDKYTNYAQL